MDTVRAQYSDESCCQGNHLNNALKTLPFVALGLFGGPIGMAVGMLSMAAANAGLTPFQGRDVKHIQLHLALGLMIGGFGRFGLQVYREGVSSSGIANLIMNSGMSGIGYLVLKSQLNAAPAPTGQPPAPSARSWGSGQPLGTS